MLRAQTYYVRRVYSMLDFFFFSRNAHFRLFLVVLVTMRTVRYSSKSTDNDNSKISKTKNVNVMMNATGTNGAMTNFKKTEADIIRFFQT